MLWKNVFENYPSYEYLSENGFDSCKLLTFCCCVSMAGFVTFNHKIKICLILNYLKDACENEILDCYADGIWIDFHVITGNTWYIYFEIVIHRLQPVL